MAEYAVHLTTDRADVTDEQLDDLVDALAPLAGVPSMLDGRLSVQLTVDDHDLVTAAAQAQHAVHTVLRYAQPVQVVAIEVMTAEEFARRLDGPPRAGDLVSTTEAAELLGVSRQRVLQLSKDRPEFPEPVRLGARGLHWSAAGVRRFAAAWERRSGPKSRAAG